MEIVVPDRVEKRISMLTFNETSKIALPALLASLRE
jgi:hypothetical protein